MIRKFLILALTVAMASSLSACGKKPRFVDPPQGKAADLFPRTYPAPRAEAPKGLPKGSETSTKEDNNGIEQPPTLPGQESLPGQQGTVP